MRLGRTPHRLAGFDAEGIVELGDSSGFDRQLAIQANTSPRIEPLLASSIPLYDNA
jgi:hypothetical protein